MASQAKIKVVHSLRVLFLRSLPVPVFGDSGVQKIRLDFLPSILFPGSSKPTLPEEFLRIAPSIGFKIMEDTADSLLFSFKIKQDVYISEEFSLSFPNLKSGNLLNIFYTNTRESMRDRSNGQYREFDSLSLISAELIGEGHDVSVLFSEGGYQNGESGSDIFGSSFAA